MQKLPEFESYFGNEGNPNALKFIYPNITVWYSYQTPVAFSFRGIRYVHTNDWSTMTGKHLNKIDGGDKIGRHCKDIFAQLLKEALQQA